MKKLAIAVPAVLALVGVLFSVQAKDTEKPTGPQKAIAVVHSASKSKVHGVVVFTQKEGHIEITGEVMGLTPGPHGFHIHEFGDCSEDDAMCAGGHFNPTKQPHAGPEDEHRHVGDLGNITADEDGKAVIKMNDSTIALHGSHSIVGRAVVVHGKADDLKSQPAGNAGPRVGCGVIGIAKMGMMHK